MEGKNPNIIKREFLGLILVSSMLLNFVFPIINIAARTIFTIINIEYLLLVTVA